jgi:hypothetical protein
MSLINYRESQSEQERIQNLFSMIEKGECALDIGSRDGYLSSLLTKFFLRVTALDLEKPNINNPQIICVQGNVCNLPFNDNSFDLVLCTEVLEHIPSHLLNKACFEITRVCHKHVLIGVPYNQDIRLGRTTCYSCGGKNPPWGHINSFSNENLISLFPDLTVEKISFVGNSGKKTNFFSTLLMDLAGNPYGSYNQEESCIFCGSKLKAPPDRNIPKRIATRIAVLINNLQNHLIPSSANWIHVLFRKNDSSLLSS